MLKENEKMNDELNDETNENAFVDTSDLENNEILQVKDDRLFHDLFNSNDMSTIEWIAKEILGCSIKDVHNKVFISETRLTRVRGQERNKYVDLLIKQKNGEFILIELNNNYYGNPIKSIAYAINLVSSYYDRNIEINNNSKKVYIKPVRGILVNLNWSPPKSNTRKTANPGKVITNWDYPADSGSEYSGYCLKIFGINLDFYEKIGYDSIKKEDKFFKLLTVKNEKELQEITKDIKELDSYVDKLKDLSNNKDYRGALMNERIVSNILKQDAYYTSYHVGIDQGIEQKQREMILEMYNKNIDIKDISDISKLTLKEVQAIIDARNNQNNLK